MNGISTHVLDTATGGPASGVRVHLFQSDQEIGLGQTDSNGRCSALLPKGVALRRGIYRLVFDIASRFPNGFYPEVSVSFNVEDSSLHYHLPLLISPFGYTTYRGN